MLLFEAIEQAKLRGPTFLTIGNFDGLHRGHQALIAVMRERAQAVGAACGLLTFHPHPRSVLRPHQPVASLSALDERLTLYRQAGLDFTVVHPFTPATAQTEAEDFVRALHEHLGVTLLWVGPDFALGRGRRGNAAFLQQFGAELGMTVEIMPEFSWEGHVIRSNEIRRLLELGNVEWAAAGLGRYYGFSGLVVHGAARGRSIGFPTANLALPASRVTPGNGVYANWAWLDEKRHPAVTNIGLRPTVDGVQRTIETHLIDFDGTLYGRCLRLDFVARLRDEMRFPGLDALRAQIERDRDRAAALLQADPQIVPYPRFRELAHTADWEIEVQAQTRPELYANAAFAMYALQGAAAIEGPTAHYAVQVTGVDSEDMLVRWLSELLWLSETQGVLFQQFAVEAVDETSLSAQVSGRVARSEMAHIKAVTYHKLALTPPTPADDFWRARVVFDT